MTKFQLMQSLFSRHIDPVAITVGATTGKVVGLQNEDGSGSCFIVTIQQGTTGLTRVDKVFVRTVD